MVKFPFNSFHFFSKLWLSTRCWNMCWDLLLFRCKHLWDQAAMLGVLATVVLLNVLVETVIFSGYLIEQDLFEIEIFCNIINAFTKMLQAINSLISASANLVFLYGSHFVHRGWLCWNRKRSYSTVNVCVRRLHGSVLDCMHLLGSWKSQMW